MRGRRSIDCFPMTVQAEMLSQSSSPDGLV